MLNRFIAVLGVVLVCCVAAPALGSVAIGTTGPGQPVTTAPVGEDPWYHFTFTDVDWGFAATGCLYATPLNDGYGGYEVTGGEITITADAQGPTGTFPVAINAPVVDPPVYNVPGDYAVSNSGMVWYDDLLYPGLSGPGGLLDGQYGIMFTNNSKWEINLWGSTFGAQFGADSYGLYIVGNDGYGQNHYDINGVMALTPGTCIPEPATMIVWSLLGGAGWLGMRVVRQGRRVGRQSWSPEARNAILEIIERGRHS
jgi:hypothetical protein